MDATLVVMIAAFAATASLVAVAGVLLSGSKAGEDGDLAMGHSRGPAGSRPEEDLFDEDVPDSRFVAFFMPSNRKGRREIAERITQAGLYKRNSTAAFLTAKGFLMLAPFGIGVIFSSLEMVPLKAALMYGGLAAAFGTILPNFWLDAKLRRRQRDLRRALPDALDVITVCLEGGLSLPAALSKVSIELRGVHRLLAVEMAIVHREVQMGRSTGEALKNFAQRFDLEELRGLAAVVLQAEKFGSSLVRAFRIQGDTLREKRMQRAEEKAQRASLLIMIPTLLFIFPNLFMVLLGPAFFEIYEVFGNISSQ